MNGVNANQVDHSLNISGDDPLTCVKLSSSLYLQLLYHSSPGRSIYQTLMPNQETTFCANRRHTLHSSQTMSPRCYYHHSNIPKKQRCGGKMSTFVSCTATSVQLGHKRVCQSPHSPAYIVCAQQIN